VVLSTSIPAQTTRHSSRDAMACDRSLTESMTGVSQHGFDVAHECEGDHQAEKFQMVRKTE